VSTLETSPHLDLRTTKDAALGLAINDLVFHYVCSMAHSGAVWLTGSKVMRKEGKLGY
jgi:hypothetical protein